MIDDPDEAVLDQLRRAGSDLTKPHEISFYVYLPDKQSAQEAERRIRSDGDQTVVRLGADDTSWLCLITRTMIPEFNSLVAVGREIAAVAQDLGGEYDGWETVVVK